MAKPVSALALLDRLRLLQDRADTTPLDWWRWTPPQMALLSSTDSRVMLRTGNQMGKTMAGLAEVVFRCVGRHPFKSVSPPPIEAWIITTSWSQSLSIQAKLWSILPKTEIVEKTHFDPARGFRGITPVIQFRNGSVIRVKTSGQGGLKLASATLGFVLGDEPFPSSRIYAEIERRLMRTGGDLYLTMTPVNAPIDWIREMAEQGAITDLHYRMTVENFTPVGSDTPLLTGAGEVMDAAWIDRQRAQVFSWEAPVVLDGEWEFRASGRVFENYQPTIHEVKSLQTSAVAPKGDVFLSIGIDYGEDRLRTAAVVVAVDTTGEYPRVYVLGEYVPTAASTMDMDADGIVQVLASLGLRWEDLDYAYGDKRYSDYSGRQTRKSNGMMLGALEKALKAGRGLRPRIYSAKRGPGAGRGAVAMGVRWINSAMIRPGHFFIDPERNPWGVQCIARWQGGEKEKWKDWLDALRYALTPWAIRADRKSYTPAIRIR